MRQENHVRASRLIRHNRIVHDLLAPTYEATHEEIFNPTEQARIASVVGEALGQLGRRASPPLALDFGAGTGNLTAHLLRLGAHVIAADVSPGCLETVERRYGGTGRLRLVELNGSDLSCLASESVDFIGAYSVLHHVPDYLGVLREFVRVVRPGGVIYIDHEASPGFWREGDPGYADYLAALRASHRPSLRRRLGRKARLAMSLRAWRRVVERTCFGLRPEGDVHVTRDDHVAWPAVEAALGARCAILDRRDYLVCREQGAEPAVHRQYSGRCADTRMILARKKEG
jgi:SAM-dependent methyltransferase